MKIFRENITIVIQDVLFPFEMAKELDFKKICRACLLESDTEPFKDLFSVCTSEVFKYCTSIEISEEDHFPQQICQTCLELLNKVYYFKQVATRSNMILKQQFDAQPINIKLESGPNENDLGDVNLLEISDIMPILDTSTNDDSATEVPQEQPEIKIRRRRQRGLPRPLKKRTRMKCPKCEKSFQKYENFEAHMRSHFGKKPDIKCEHCDKTFPTLRNLNSHVRTHTGVRKYQCLTCGKNFAYLNVLKNHELIHLGVKKHVCHICDARFVQRYNLKTHLETHTKEKNYGCSQCGKKFAQPGYLKIHLIRHSGVKNIACSLCDMRFFVKSDLFKHMRSHSTEKPFSCDYCDKTFKSKNFQVIHLRTHTGERPYACDICPKRFMARKDMRNHRMIHTGEKPHKCLLCNQAFIQKCALNRHIKSHGHGKTAEESILLRTQLITDATPISVAYTQWHSDV